METKITDSRYAGALGRQLVVRMVLASGRDRREGGQVAGSGQMPDGVSPANLDQPSLEGPRRPSATWWTTWTRWPALLIAELTISEDTYQPLYESFDLGFNPVRQ